MAVDGSDPPSRDDGPAAERSAYDPASASGFLAGLAGRGESAGGLTNGRGGPAAHRLDVFRNNVIHSLAEALGATFPATRRAMSDAEFRGAAVAYARAEKPTSPILLRYGGTFPAFLMASGRLPRTIGEVAALEFARVQAYHAADVAPLEPADLAALPEDRLAGATFTPHPATALIATPHGGHGVWLAGAPDDAVAALVTRPVMDVRVTPLAGDPAAFAAHLLAGLPLGEAAGAFDVATALATLLSTGAFAAVR